MRVLRAAAWSVMKLAPRRGDFQNLGPLFLEPLEVRLKLIRNGAPCLWNPSYSHEPRARKL